MAVITVEWFWCAAIYKKSCNTDVSMKQVSTFHQYILHDVLGEFQGITTRPLFGGHGLYLYGTIFGLIVHDELYFKVDKQHQQEYVTLKSHPFTYKNTKGKIVQMPYWVVPDTILNDKEQLLRFLRMAHALGLAEEEHEVSQNNEYTIKAKVWIYADDTWYFITIPEQQSDAMKEQFAERAKGWGSLPVSVTIGKTSWKTSLFPSTELGAYILPLKREVRVKEGIGAGKEITVRLQITL